jgi:hypothetical protein
MKMPGSLLRRGMPRSWINLEKWLPLALHTTTVQVTNQPEMLESTPRHINRHLLKLFSTSPAITTIPTLMSPHTPLIMFLLIKSIVPAFVIEAVDRGQTSHLFTTRSSMASSLTTSRARSNRLDLEVNLDEAETRAHLGI